MVEIISGCEDPQIRVLRVQPLFFFIACSTSRQKPGSIVRYDPAGVEHETVQYADNCAVVRDVEGGQTEEGSFIHWGRVKDAKIADSSWERIVIGASKWFFRASLRASLCFCHLKRVRAGDGQE